MNVASKVYETLRKKRYSRDQPFLENKLKETISYCIKKNKPIKLIGFWGVGPKTQANWADEATGEFLARLNEEIRTIYPPGIKFTFIIATLHGIHNGINSETIKSYSKSIESIFKKYNFKFIYLDPLWKKYHISFKKVDKILEQQPRRWWSNIENHEVIEINAKKRNKRLKYKIAAKKYYLFRNLEKEMFEKEFPTSIFFAFADSILRNIFPKMPTLYFYSRKGWSDAPWFVKA